jgi:hypothetical protein
MGERADAHARAVVRAVHHLTCITASAIGTRTHRLLVGLCLELRLASSPPTKDCTAAMGYGMTTEEQANPVQIPAGSCSSRRSRFRFVSRPGGRQFSLLLAVRMDDCVC